MFGHLSVCLEIFPVYILLVLNIPRYAVEEGSYFDLGAKHKRMNHRMQK
jgi:hypothetical protein